MKLLVIPYIIGILFYLCVKLSSLLIKSNNDLKIYFEQRLFTTSSVSMIFIGTLALGYVATNRDTASVPATLALVMFISVEIGKVLSYVDSRLGVEEISYEEIEDGEYYVRPMKPFGLFTIYWGLLSIIATSSLFFTCYLFMSSIVGVVAITALYLVFDIIMCIEIIRIYNDLLKRKPTGDAKYDSKGNLL